MRILLWILVAFAVAPAVQGQALIAERTVAWRSFAAERSARVRAFHAGDSRRPTTVVVDDAAGNAAPVTDDAPFVAELAARELGLDPVETTFVFRFTPAAFNPAAGDGGKTLLLGATFRRTASGGLGAPTWRVLSSEALQELTDRAMR